MQQPPTNRTIPNAHARAIVAAAVDVAMARQAQQLAEQAMQSELDQAIAEGISPAGLYVSGTNPAAVILATVNLARAVDTLTEVCVAAQVAHDAQNN